MYFKPLKHHLYWKQKLKVNEYEISFELKNLTKLLNFLITNLLGIFNLIMGLINKKIVNLH